MSKPPEPPEDASCQPTRTSFAIGRGESGRRETAWSRDAATLAQDGTSRAWMLERVICAHRGYTLTGPRERALVWELLEIWDEHDQADAKKAKR